MGYRQLDKKPRHPRRDFVDTATRNKVFVQNGVLSHLAIPCWYLEIFRPRHAVLHSIDLHDHIGWPDPDHPDHSCQDAHHGNLHDHPHHRNYPGHIHPNHPYHPNIHYHNGHWHDPHILLDLSKTFPIHLKEEGYTTVDVVFKDPPEGITASAFIDDTEDWVIRVDIDLNCEEAISDDIEVPYSIFVNGSFKDSKTTTRTMRNIVAKGILHILAGPII